MVTTLFLNPTFVLKILATAGCVPAPTAPGPHRPFYSKVKKDPNNMSNYETNPVGALQERFQSRGITPQYRVVQAEGASHAPTFSFQVWYHL